MNRILGVCVLVAAWVLCSGPYAGAEPFSLKNREDKQTLVFQPKGPGKVVLTGKWEGSAKSLDVALYDPSQFLSRWRGTASKNPFEYSWDISERDLEESRRPWKIVLRARRGEATGEASVTGSAVDPAGEKPKSEETPGAPPGQEVPAGQIAPPKKDEMPSLPLDEFGLRVRRTFLETPYYKPWVEKITVGKKSDKLHVRPLGLTVTPAVRKIRTRYGSLSLTVRNITLTPAQNVNLQESISGGPETSFEIVIRAEIPGWYLMAMQMEPFTAYPGEMPRLTAMEIETRSISRGTLEPATSWPFASSESVLLVPMLFSQPGEYIFSGRPISREPGEILFLFRGIELYQLGS
ncbi:hypothetical protein HY522_12565 [bacterium]|nr:hypothetical protein [bacterium]